MDLNSEPAAHDQQTLEQFVVFIVDSEEYAVPIAAVTEVVPFVEIISVPGAPAYVLGLMNLRGKVVPVLDLEKKFGLTRDTQAARQHIMIAESAQKMLFGIVVDHVEEVLKISNDRIKPAPEAVKNNISAEYLGGVLILGGRQDQQAAQATASKERVLLILDLQKILSDADAAELRAAQAPQSTPTNAINEGGTV